MLRQAVVIDPKDNLATAVADLTCGCEVRMFIAGKDVSVVVCSDIPFGHKFATRDIPCHEPVIKYGESIGRATKAIKTGEHVHVHNVESERGRGDWTKQ